jgi:hypothetical protein
MKLLHLASRLFLGCALVFGMFSLAPQGSLQAEETVAPTKCLDGNRNKCMESTVGSTTMYYYWV